MQPELIEEELSALASIFGDDCDIDRPERLVKASSACPELLHTCIHNTHTYTALGPILGAHPCVLADLQHLKQSWYKCCFMQHCSLKLLNVRTVILLKLRANVLTAGVLPCPLTLTAGVHP